ncbi:MAG: hypothetical protein AAF564_15255 [Bacteroidota bacterium]
MRALRSTLGKRIVTISLLLSLLALLVSPAVRDNQYNSSSKYANWLRSQLGDVTSEAVEYAFAAALEVNAENLDAFINAFVKAYAYVETDNGVSVTSVALFALLKHRSLLVDSAVPPHLLLKSALMRTLHSQDRGGSSLFAAFERVTAVKFGQQLVTFVSHVTPLYTADSYRSISPRAP